MLYISYFEAGLMPRQDEGQNHGQRSQQLVRLLAKYMFNFIVNFTFPKAREGQQTIYCI